MLAKFKGLWEPFTTGWVPRKSSASAESRVASGMAFGLPTAELVPVFVARMLPKAWVHELWRQGGFALILKY
jgi:hypothetical protein